MCVKAVYLLVIFTANLHAVCQPNVMQICSDIIENLHHILCVKALNHCFVLLGNNASSW